MKINNETIALLQSFQTSIASPYFIETNVIKYLKLLFVMIDDSVYQRQFVLIYYSKFDHKSVLPMSKLCYFTTIDSC